MSTAYNLPTGDFVTTTLNGALTSAATSGTIGGGLNIPATSGILHLDYNSLLAVGVDNGPETISYTAYNTSTGALTGVTRGVAGTTGVAHANSAKVQAGMSIGYLTGDAAAIIQQSAFSPWVPSFTGFSANPTGVTAKYLQVGKLVFCYIDVTAGTSNATSFTLSLPVAAKFAISCGGITVQDNGTVATTPGRLVLSAASTTASVIKDAASGSWTNSGTKGLFGSWFYEAN